MKTVLFLAGGAALLLAAYMVLWPVPIDPAPWEPPAHAPSAWTPSGDFEAATRVPLADGLGPEDVEVDEAGRIFAGLEDGRIVRWNGLDSPPNTLANTEGRPLGLHWDASGRLLIADAFAGLLRMRPEGGLEVLATECGGTPLVFTDDVDVAADGTVYFTDASIKFDQHHWKNDILESGANGRLCQWREGEEGATELLSGLHFANGVAVDPEQRFVLVNETSRYRVLRYDLKDGSTRVLIDNLPGFPDGISTGSDGVFWIAIASPRNPLVDALAPSPFLRKVVQRLPEALKPAPERTTRVIGIDETGRVQHDLWDATGATLAMVTSVQERGKTLYLGSLSDDAIAALPVPETPH